ncbi:MAG: type II toxin-antitoxin system PemK/MazF family toxin [Planctomycetaceae bacterium]
MQESGRRDLRHYCFSGQIGEGEVGRWPQKRAQSPGNVLLDLGEADLPKPSVVIVSQIFTVDKSQVDEYIGALSKQRVRQILEGIFLLTEPREIE